MSDKDIKSWNARLKDQVDRKWENYKRWRINLDDARDRLFFCIAGEFIYVEKVSSISANATIRLDSNTRDPIDLKKGTEIKTVFREFYITNEAQSNEWIDVIIGINFNYRQAQEQNYDEAQTCIILTNAGVGNVQAASNPCNRVLIRAHTGNGGTIWINFGAAGAVNTCYELTAGDAISVPCSNTDRIQGWFTNGGDRATIVYES